jgi:hypothetical protein
MKPGRAVELSEGEMLAVATDANKRQVNCHGSRCKRESSISKYAYSPRLSLRICDGDSSSVLLIDDQHTQSQRPWTRGGGVRCE